MCFICLKTDNYLKMRTGPITKLYTNRSEVHSFTFPLLFTTCTSTMGLVFDMNEYPVTHGIHHKNISELFIPASLDRSIVKAYLLNNGV